MAKTPKTTKKTAAAPKAADKKRGVGDAAIEALRAGKSNEEALAAVKAEFPDASTSLAAINWYRNKLRSEGEEIPTARDLRREARKLKKNRTKAADPLDG